MNRKEKKPAGADELMKQAHAAWDEYDLDEAERLFKLAARGLR